MPTTKHNDDDALDEHGVLKDGHSIRVTMQMADSASDGLKKVVHEYDEKGREKSSFHYQEDDLEKLMKDAQANSAAARSEMISTMTDAWKTDASIPTGVGSHGTYEAAVGSPCMTDGSHEPGVLTKGADGRLVCTPTRPKKDSATTDARADAYQQSLRDREAAWR